MKFILQLLLTALLVVIFSKVIPGVSTDGYFTAILVALVLSLLNFIVRPILVLLTLPVTVLTLGLFLLIINAIILYMADWLISGFQVGNLFWAIIFSLLLALGRSFLFKILEKDN